MTRLGATLPQKSGWRPRLAGWSLWLAVASLAVAGIGLTLARYDAVAKLAGFSALLGGGLVAALALVLGLVAVIALRRRPTAERRRAIAGIAVSLLFVGFLASRALGAADAPAIHDVTTDLADPPEFEALPLRSDNLAGVGTVDNWRAIHAAAYGDLRPIVVARPVSEVTRDAARLAQEAGWKIAWSDPARGRVEATASVSYIRFHDDVVIRVAPVAGGAHSRVDMRSVSRVGVSDLGVNARRIRDFLASLAAS